MTSTPTSLHRLSAITLMLGGSLTMLISGCASKPPPKEEMAVANAAIQRANTSSTSENAGAQLQVATGKLASARQAMAAKDFERARQLAEQAQVDAQVAELHAQSALSRQAAKESQDAARVLTEEINRNTGR